MSAVQDNTVQGGAESKQAAADAETPFRRFVADYAENKIAVFGALSVLLVGLVALFGPLIAPTDPYDLASVTFMDNLLLPGEQMGSGVTATWSAP